MHQWLVDHLAWITAASIACTVLLTGVGVFVVVLLPVDYFDRGKRQPAVLPGRHPIGRLLFRIFKNIVGLLALILGIILALPLVPGPGMLFILLGVSMMDVPGKFALERRLIGNRLVLKSVNLLRTRFHRPPMTFSQAPHRPATTPPLPGEAAP